MCLSEAYMYMKNYTHKRPLCGHCAPPLQKPSQSVCTYGLTSWGFMVKENRASKESEEKKMKNAEARWPKESTMEKLGEMRYGTSGAILRYGEQILAVGREFRGFHAAVYEMVETPEETGFADIECRLNLVEAATELFEDGGHAMAWCMAHI